MLDASASIKELVNVVYFPMLVHFASDLRMLYRLVRYDVKSLDSNA